MPSEMASKSLISAVLSIPRPVLSATLPTSRDSLRSRLQHPSDATCRSNGDPHPWRHLTMFISKSRIASHQAAAFVVRLVYRNRLACIEPSCFYLRHVPLSLRFTDKRRGWVQAMRLLSLNYGPCHCSICAFEYSYMAVGRVRYGSKVPRSRLLVRE
ncbi:hypothetical protein BKA58DRAFT_43619 [Alternaria rosae]|uniref:uncharacterized protein n=1 Tax=Alternaria rosae TaxID=1187941 RepID=UPI001E8DC10D|nr:uncharacterized protein BKA58DRAFT_43619 [Alternaria rosae]KAH6860976.1 hypothetical protein BKA58DRAFT_43619 [Alternaria rosae]